MKYTSNEGYLIGLLGLSEDKQIELSRQKGLDELTHGLGTFVFVVGLTGGVGPLGFVVSGVLFFMWGCFELL